MEHSKTNAMRLLDKAGIKYHSYSYDASDGKIDGISVAGKLGLPIEKVYKTLVTQGHSKNFFVFILQVAEELDLKAAARSVGEKSIEMIKMADINKVTGYIRGGCSPLGMKKDYTTVLDSTAEDMDKIIVSAGKIGQQIELNPRDLIRLIHCKVDIISLKKKAYI